jgi:hypothetical protein
MGGLVLMQERGGRGENCLHESFGRWSPYIESSTGRKTAC